MPAANVAELRKRLDQFARARLTLADFEPVLDLDGELSLTDVTPELFQALQLLQPYGMANPEPIFAARAELTAPPRILKEKHIKLKVRTSPSRPVASESSELSADAILVTPRCHPDSATIKRSERAAVVDRSQGPLGTENGEPKMDFRTKITFDALGWNMAERLQKTPLLAGDRVHIAFTIGNNDRSEFGGLELELRDLKI